ncbi:MAG TPA: TetR/AcrR family transcriptional regulator, partial [Candidatus Binataceae bacterium]|nr:TetR/AcrR family transcriptional regulator [Candidatus Binataceae bacterium]
SLINAAIRVFSLKGFRRAQMADIAREMGVSPGLLYNYVESKEALFYLVIDQGFSNPPLGEPRPLPVRNPPPGAIVKRIAEHFLKEAATPALSAALKLPRAEDPGVELEAIVRELYGNIYRTAYVTTMLDRSALDMPELAEFFYGRMRGGAISMLTSLIGSRAAAGQFRRVPHPAVAARLILETITWPARNRRGDPNSQDIDDESAEETTIDFIVNALVASPRPSLPIASPAAVRASNGNPKGEPQS